MSDNTKQPTNVCLDNATVFKSAQEVVADALQPERVPDTQARTPEQKRYRRRGFIFLFCTIAMFALSWAFLFWAFIPNRWQHFPATMWVLTELLVIFLALLTASQFKKSRPPEDDD